jgi:hypothetical protein
MYWAVLMTRKGGVPPDWVLNAITLSQILQQLKTRRPVAHLAQEDISMPALEIPTFGSNALAYDSRESLCRPTWNNR